MPRAKCISRGTYYLTVGREYEIELSGTESCSVVDDRGISVRPYRNRFEIIYETTTVQEGFRLEVGRVVTVRSDLISGDEFRDGSWEVYEDHSQYAGRRATITRIDTNDNSFKIDIDNGYSWWIEEMCETAPTIQTTSDNAFAVYDIVKITKEGSRKDMLTYITKITQGNKIFTGLSNFDSFKADELVKVAEEDFNVPLLVVPELAPYTQRTCEVSPTTGSRIKMPTRKTRSSALDDNKEILNEIEKGTKYLKVDKVFTSEVRVIASGSACYFSSSDLEVLPTKFVQGTIENGHRIKDDNGKTHTYEAYATGFNTLISETTNYIEYTDSTGWYILQFKGLVTKPRGTVQYTEYFTLCPEDYIAYKAEQEERSAYLKSVIDKEKVVKTNSTIQHQKSMYESVKIAVQRAKTTTERIAREKAEREERERQIEEERKYGIWKHHKDIWN